jgi:hypothetical protein
MLHITNGESAASGIRQSGVEGPVVAWNDVLHEGPVPAGLSIDGLTGLRARFLSGPDGASYEDVLRSLRARDRALEESAAEDEVVLWFEHDLYDQLKLLQILDWYAANARPPTLTLVCRDEYLGPLAPERLAGRFRQRAPVTRDQLAVAARAWSAYRAEDPRGLMDVISGDTSALPFLRAALDRHLQQFPSTFNGLSRSEQQGLEAVAAGATTLAKAFVASHLEREEAIFLGDLVFWDYMRELSGGPHPLVALKGTDFRSTEIALTDAGRDVLDGRADRVRLNGLDRWYGGVHLSDHDARWRWNGHSLVEHPAPGT